MGVPFQEILAVLSLQSDCMLIGDGLSEASGCVLLLDGSLVAFAAFLDEADRRVNYSSSCVCARDSAKTCEELWKKYPGFMKSLASPLGDTWKSHRTEKATEPMPPLRVSVMDSDWGVDFEARGLRRFRPSRAGLPNLPAAAYTPEMPKWLQEALQEIRPSCDAFNWACHEVEQICGPEHMKGRGRGKGYSPGPCRRTFAEACAMLREKLQSTQRLEPVLTALAAAEPPDSTSYSLSDLRMKHIASLPTDTVFGPGKTWIDCSGPQSAMHT
ncbi:unnamed protein product [Effrenium voratum]|nr:unnamed protein product [Effrenium voratum]